MADRRDDGGAARARARARSGSGSSSITGSTATTLTGRGDDSGDSGAEGPPPAARRRRHGGGGARTDAPPPPAALGDGSSLSVGLSDEQLLQDMARAGLHGDLFDHANASGLSAGSSRFPGVDAMFGGGQGGGGSGGGGAPAAGPHLGAALHAPGAAALGDADLSMLASLLAQQDGLSPEEAAQLLEAALAAGGGGAPHHPPAVVTAPTAATAEVPPPPLEPGAAPQEGGEDGYVVVLLSTLRESAASLAECEADLAEARKQRCVACCRLGGWG